MELIVVDNKELFFKLKALKEQYQYTMVQEEGVIKNSLKAAKVVGSHAAFLAAPVPGTALVSINNLKNGLRRTIKRAKANKRSGKPIFRQNNPVDNFDITKDVKKMGDHALHALKHPKETGKAIKDKATETLNSLKDKLKKKNESLKENEIIEGLNIIKNGKFVTYDEWLNMLSNGLVSEGVGIEDMKKYGKNALRGAKVLTAHGVLLYPFFPGGTMLSVYNMKKGYSKTIKKARQNKKKGLPLLHNNDIIDNFDVTKDIVTASRFIKKSIDDPKYAYDVAKKKIIKYTKI